MTQPMKKRAHGVEEGKEASDQGSQYLTFSLGGDLFGMPIQHIREIIEYGDVTSVPMMPEAVRGVINLRGAVVPVVDLSVRFGRHSTAVSKRTCIVIIENQLQEDEGDSGHYLGIIVDAVNEVLEIPEVNIEDAPAFGVKIRTDFIQAMGKVDGKFVILLDVGKVLSVEELSQLQARDQGDDETAQE